MLYGLWREGVRGTELFALRLISGLVRGGVRTGERARAGGARHGPRGRGQAIAQHERTPSERDLEFVFIYEET
jgi:hypothetical protein